MLFYTIISVLLVSVIAKERIAGGDPVLIEKYPYAVSLLTNAGEGAYTFGCGGTLITNRAILSAASCFYTSNVVNPPAWWRGRVGSTYSNSGGTIYFINRITPHTAFSTVTLDNDIAVLRTSLQVTLVPGSVETARVAGVLYSFVDRQPLIAIGWGATSQADLTPSSELREAEVYVVDQSTCSSRYTDLSFTVTSNMVCAGWLDMGVREQCEGDNGSPLVDPQLGSGTNVIVAVFSKSHECATDGRYPGINTRLVPYLNWIAQTAYQN